MNEIAIKKLKIILALCINKNIPKTILYTTFSFNEIETDLIKKMIKNLDSKKSGIFGNISANCLQVVSDTLSLTYWFGWNDEVVHKTRTENFPVN